MIDLILVVTALVTLSFLCSIMESVILSISRPYIRILLDSKKHYGSILKRMKDDINEPIAAILTLNTIAHTVGAAVAGAIAAELFGSRWMGLFSAILTLLILVLSEIIPKTIGARYWKLLSRPSAYLLRSLIFILKPLLVPMNFISRLFARADQGEQVSKAEIFNFMRMGYDQGVIEKSELMIMDNLLKLRDVRVKDIMTPRQVVEYLEPDQKIGDIRETVPGLNFSRIPLYNSRTNRIFGSVLRRDLMKLIHEKKFNKSIRSLSGKPEYIPDATSVLKLVKQFVKKGVHLGFVINEFGDYTGIVTLEDAIETLLGVEIVDEYDPVVDMRALALQKMAVRKKKGKKK
ncbi:MAG: DUF21 domain-containing protein [Spirochaetes bacterium]|nr:DUF21 domain-containing protein [Spirochaetota bacterium]